MLISHSPAPPAHDRRPLFAVGLAIAAPTVSVLLGLAAGVVIATGDEFVNTDNWVSIVFLALQLCAIAALATASSLVAASYLLSRPASQRWLAWTALAINVLTIATFALPAGLALASLLAS